MRFIDLFAGIGGIRLGLTEAGFECVYSIDKDIYASKTYQENFEENPLGDIKILDTSTLPNFEVLAGGFPCQPFSISGKQKGFEDETRGTLFFDILRIIKDKKPQVILLENVANLENHDKGNTFRVIKDSLIKEGYKVFFKVLNSYNFGIPQSRARIFIVAFLNKNINFEFPLGSKERPSLRSVLENRNDFEYLPIEEYTLIDSPKVSPNGLMFVGYLNKNIRKNGVREGTLHLSRTHRQSYRIYSADYAHPTLTASQPAGRYYIYDGIGVRKLTLLETFRLQGFQDDFKKPVSKSQLYKQIGNSVSIPVIREIGLKIKEALENIK